MVVVLLVAVVVEIEMEEHHTENKIYVKIGMLILLFVSQQMWACSCSLGDVHQKFKEHVSIFQGDVTDIIYYDSKDMSGDQYIRVTFDIEKQWKGDKDQNQLLTVYNGSSCYGYWFKKGQKYIVYAFEDGDHLNNWWCGGVIQQSETPEKFNKEAQALDDIVAK